MGRGTVGGGGVTEILVIRWKSIGDVVFALPAVHALRARFPAARITFMVSRENAFIPEGFGAVDRVWTLDRAALRGRGILGGLVAAARLLGATRRAGFSLAVDLQGYGETAAFTRWSGAPQRWGYRAGALRNRAYTTSIQRSPGRHPALAHLDLLAAAGLDDCAVDNTLAIPITQHAQARQFLAAQGIATGTPWAYLQPFTSTAAKNWPLDRYQRIAATLRSRGCRLLWGGGDADRRAMLDAGVPGHEMLPPLPRAVVAAVLAHATLVVGGDTGFVHLAVALQRPVVMVGIRGMVPPLTAHGIAVKGDTDRIADVPVERVEQAVLEELRSQGTGRGKGASRAISSQARHAPPRP